MRITYDHEVDAFYIRFEETTVTTKHVSEGISIDYDADGKVAGIEILDVSRHLAEINTLRKVILEDIALAHP